MELIDALNRYYREFTSPNSSLSVVMYDIMSNPRGRKKFLEAVGPAKKEQAVQEGGEKKTKKKNRKS